MISDSSIFAQGDAVAGTEDLFRNSAPDAEQNGYDGDTIQQNTPFYFYVQHDSRLSIELWDQNDGSVNKTKTVQRQQIDPLVRLHGEGANTHTLSWIPYFDQVDITFFGKSPSYTANGRVLTFDQDQCPACCTIIYNFEAQQYKYTPPHTDLVDQDDQYPVAIRFFLETVKVGPDE